MKASFVRIVLAAAAMVAGPGSSWAATNAFLVPPSRGSAGSTFNGWENFTVAIGDPGNAGDLATSAGNARLYQLAPGAQVLGSGNIYNGADRSRFEIRYSSPSPVGEVILQVRTLGTELGYDSARLTAAGQDFTTPRVELERVSFGPPPPNPGGGVAVSSYWKWDLTPNNVTDFTLSFSAAEMNLSFDSATLDVLLVPEPGPAGLAILGAGIVWLGRRKKS